MARSPRADWPIRVVSPSEDSPDLSASTTPEQRLAMVWELTKEAWAWAGLAIPDYPRAETPIARRPLR
jgi:hypothetical protein